MDNQNRKVPPCEPGKSDGVVLYLTKDKYETLRYISKTPSVVYRLIHAEVTAATHNGQLNQSLLGNFPMLVEFFNVLFGPDANEENWLRCYEDLIDLDTYRIVKLNVYQLEKNDGLGAKGIVHTTVGKHARNFLRDLFYDPNWPDYVFVNDVPPNFYH